MGHKNKIIIITSENFPYGGPGANYLRNLSSGLQLNSSYHIVLWLQSGNSRPNGDFQNKRKNSIDGIDYKYIGNYALRPRSTFGKIVNDFFGIVNPIFCLIKEGREIKALIVYNSSSIMTAIPLFLCKILKIKIIKIIPEWYEKESVITSKLKYIKWWDFIIGIKKLNFHFDGLIVLSYYLKNYYVSNGYPENKIAILPNLVNVDQFSGYTFKKDEKKKVIGYSGSPVKKDGILDLLNAFGLLIKKHENIELLIIGDISQTKTVIPFLKGKANDFGIPENQLYFTGMVDFTEVPKLLNRCDILILSRPSGQFAEAGFPTKLGEYLACKKPVVLTKVGDIPKYFVDKYNAVLVEPDNPESICKGLSFLIENPEKAKSIAQEGYEWAIINLELKKATIKIVNFIESI